MLFTSWTCDNFTELHYKVAKGILILKYSCQLSRQSLFHLWTKTCIFATYTRLFPMADHWRNGVLAGLSLIPDDHQLMRTRQHCLSKVCDILCDSIHVLRLALSWKNNIQAFFVGQTRRRQAFMLPSVSAVTGIIANIVPVNPGFQLGFLT
jgi:hypothetical protein